MLFRYKTYKAEFIRDATKIKQDKKAEVIIIIKTITKKDSIINSERLFL